VPIAHDKPRLLFVQGLVVVLAFSFTFGQGGCVRAAGCLWSELFFQIQGVLAERSGRGS
jgi:hypothetical protein